LAQILNQRARIGLVHVRAEAPAGAERERSQHTIESILLDEVDEADRLPVVRSPTDYHIDQNVGVE
jgi:hypothetical protein